MSARARFVLPFVVVVLAIAVAILFVLDRRGEHREQAGRDATAAASSTLERLLTYSPTTVSTDLAKERALLTGDFKRDYANLVTTVVAPSAKKDKVTAQSTVADAGVVSISGDKVVVLAFVNVTVTSPSATDPKISGSRVRVTMRKVDGTWRMSGFKPV